MAMIRRFVNIVVESGVSSLHRVDVSKHLFYPSTAHVTTGGMTERLQELPAPWIRIVPPVTTPMTESPKHPFFALVNSSSSSSEGMILHVDKRGHSLMYNPDAPHYSALVPSLNDDKGHVPILVSVAPPSDAQTHHLEDLYVMSRRPRRGFGSCFDVLRLNGARPEWQALPPPPFVYSHGYNSSRPAIACSHAVVDGGRSICVSFLEGYGTYCFDTVECAWRQAGDWVLPFDGDAEYASDLNLWLGFSPGNPHQLCWTSDLVMDDQPPELQGTWEDLVVPDNNWLLSTLRLINLGSSRFCIAKFFLVKHVVSSGYYDHWDIDYEIAVLTGIEIAKGAQGHMVLKHKSILCTSSTMMPYGGFYKSSR